MDFFVLVSIAVVGIALGTYFSRKRRRGLIAKQAKEKEKNKERILKFLSENEKVANDDIEDLLGVSDATATRYMDELENEGKVIQVGSTGRGVYYTLK